MLAPEQIEALAKKHVCVVGAGYVRPLDTTAFARAIEAEVRKEDEALILQSTLALEMPCQWRSPQQNEIVSKAIGAARARLGEKEPT